MSTRHVNMKRMKLSDMKPAEYNPRTIDDVSKAGLASSIDEFGLVEPIIVNTVTGNIVGGHQRYNKLLEEGTTETDVVEVELTVEKEKMLNITLNNTNITGTYDVDALQPLLKDIHQKNADLFKSLRLDELKLPNFGERDPELPGDDDVPEGVPPTAKLGDLYILGEHRLLCGESTNIEDVDLLMDGNKADMVFTDPPYNIDYGNIKHEKFKQRSIENDNMSADEFREFCAKFAECIKNFCDGVIYVFGPPGADGRIMFTVLDSAFHCSTTIIWNKDQFTLGRGKYQNKYEPCWFGWNVSGANFIDDRKLTNVWDFPRPKKSELHPTMKPVVVVENALTHASKKGGSVLDLFGGSGTTMVACEKTDRKCYMMELDEKYVDVIINRWQNFTGKEAIHSSGKTYDEMIKSRAKQAA